MDLDDQKVERESYFLHCLQINHFLLFLQVFITLGYSLCYQSFYYLMSPFSHLSLDSVGLPFKVFPLPSSEPTQRNSSSSQISHLLSLPYTWNTKPYWCKIIKPKESEPYFLNSGYTLELPRELLKMLLPRSIKSASLGLGTGNKYLFLFLFFFFFHLR